LDLARNRKVAGFFFRLSFAGFFVAIFGGIPHSVYDQNGVTPFRIIPQGRRSLT
jgi:hypothetical protein